MVPVTKFTSLSAVEAWDASYRWREGGALRDMTVDATWWRVAESIASVEGPQAPLWAHRFADAFSRWRLLPDERLLQRAGTNAAFPDLTAPAAVVNVAAFVRGGHQPGFDRSRLADTAALAVRLLDDALLLHGDGRGDLHVGLIGLADAFRMLDMPFGSERAREFAATVASALAEGCLRGNVDAASERGAFDDVHVHGPMDALLRKRAMPERLVDEALRHGLRHARATAIEPHPSLARLANEATDALDAMPDDARSGHDEYGIGIREAQARLAGAMQPFVDREIRHTALEPRACVASASDSLACLPR